MKTSIRFYNDREVRAVWDEEKSQWFFSVLDIAGYKRVIRLNKKIQMLRKDVLLKNKQYFEALQSVFGYLG